MNIQITKIGTKFLETDSQIIDIDICNGNWKYNDDRMESTEKESLTINTICKSSYLSLPVKDAYPVYDHDLFKATGEIQVAEALVRTYDSLIDYLNHRVNNVKDDYKKHGWTEREFTIVLYDLSTRLQKDIVKDLVYEKEALLEVKIKVIE